jgi:hypothetical protein
LDAIEKRRILPLLGTEAQLSDPSSCRLNTMAPGRYAKEHLFKQVQMSVVLTMEMRMYKQMHKGILVSLSQPNSELPHQLYMHHTVLLYGNRFRVQCHDCKTEGCILHFQKYNSCNRNNIYLIPILPVSESLNLSCSNQVFWVKQRTLTIFSMATAA